MPAKDSRVDDYIARAAPFAQPILKHLRKIVHAGCPQATETLKWQFPHFDYKGTMCGMAAFQNHCSFGFRKAALIFGDNGAAETEGMGQFGRITSVRDLPNERTLIAYVRQAAKLNDEGIKAPARAKPKERAALNVPEYFAAALRKNPKARKTFENFSASQRREYVEWVAEAKRQETRQQRLQTSLKWMAEGKIRNWKYRPKKS